MEELEKEFRDVLERLLHLGWTQAAIADQLGLSWHAVHKWHIGKEPPRALPAMLVALRNLEGVSPPKKKRYGPDAPQRQPKKRRS
jgi:hypothetical protein